MEESCNLPSWVSWKEQKPEQNELVLVTNGKDMGIIVNRTDSKDFYGVNSIHDNYLTIFDHKDITHWLRIPETEFTNIVGCNYCNVVIRHQTPKTVEYYTGPLQLDGEPYKKVVLCDDCFIKAGKRTIIIDSLEKKSEDLNED